MVMQGVLASGRAFDFCHDPSKNPKKIGGQ